MSVYTYMLSFNADAQGLTDEGISPNVTFAFVGTDGSPSAGCVQFSGLTGTGTYTGKAKTGVGSWTDFGVPGSATVTSVQVTGYNSKTGFVSGSLSANILGIVGSSFVPVYSGGNLLDLTPNSAQPWTAQGAGPLRSVSSTFQNASHAVYLELAVSFTLGVHPLSLLLDTLVLEITTAGGGAVYTEAGNGKAAGRGATIDAIDFLDAGGAVTAAKGKNLSDLLAITDTGNAVAAVFGSGVDGADMIEGVAAVFGSGIDTFSVFEHITGALAIFGSGSDVPVYLGRVYNEAGKGRVALFGTALLDLQGGVDMGNAATAAFGTNLSDLLAVTDAAEGITAVRGSLTEARVYTETGNGKMAVKGASKDVGRFADIGRAHAAVMGSTIDVQASLQAIKAKAAIRGAGAHLLAVTGTPNGKVAVKGATVDALAVVNALSGRLAVKGAGKDVTRLVDRGNGKATVKGNAPVEVRIFSDVINGRVGVKGTNRADTGAFADGVGGAVGVYGTAKDDYSFTVDDLIRTLRAFVGDTLPEVTAVPEALTEALFGATGATPPYVVLVAQAPRMDEDTAVFSNAQWVDVDIVYCVKNISGRDNATYARARLNVYADAVFKDFHLSRGTVAKVANDTEILETPYQRRNEYQQFFSDNAQPITAHALTISCRMVRDVSP